MDDLKKRTIEDLKNTRNKYLLEKLPTLTKGQLLTLCDNPDVRDKLMGVFVDALGDADLFHDLLKKG